MYEVQGRLRKTYPVLDLKKKRYDTKTESRIQLLFNLRDKI